MRTLFSLIFLLLPVCVMAAQSADLPTADTVLKAVQQRFSGDHTATRINDFSGNFYQKAHIASLGRTRTGRGTITMHFAMDKAGNPLTKLRWLYEVPSNQQVISDGRTLWVYQPDNNQVMLSKIDDRQDHGNDPMLFLRNLARLEHFFTVSWATPARNEANDYRLQLTPKQSSSYIQNLTLTIPYWLLDEAAPAGFPLRRAAILDPTGNNTEIEFRQIRLNLNPPQEQFCFELPEKVEIVRLSDLKLGFK